LFTSTVSDDYLLASVRNAYRVGLVVLHDRISREVAALVERLQPALLLVVASCGAVGENWPAYPRDMGRDTLLLRAP